VLEKKLKMRWGFVLITGIIALAFGIFINLYEIVVVRSGPFLATTGGDLISGFFLIGIGIPCVSLASLIRALETKIKKMEEALP